MAHHLNVNQLLPTLVISPWINPIAAVIGPILRNDDMICAGLALNPPPSLSHWYLSLIAVDNSGLSHLVLTFSALAPLSFNVMDPEMHLLLEKQAFRRQAGDTPRGWSWTRQAAFHVDHAPRPWLRSGAAGSLSRCRPAQEQGGGSWGGDPTSKPAACS